jgi:hypothetical protein
MAERGDEELRGHGVRVSADGTELYAWHWDAGMVRIDISDPTAPTFVNAVGHESDQEGNAHSGWVDPNGRFLITNNEDLHPFEDHRDHVAGWGYQHIYDLSDPAHPMEVGVFATENAIPGADGEIALDGFYTAHDVVVAGDLAVASWYSDGVRILDLTDITQPVEVGSFVPPPAADPHGYWVAPDGTKAIPAVWGVQLVGDLVFASDINSGLWIFRIGDESQPEAAEADLPATDLFESRDPVAVPTAADAVTSKSITAELASAGPPGDGSASGGASW